MSLPPETMRTLHITNWYPNRWKPLESQFIKEHVSALPETVQRQLWHIEVRHEGSLFRLHSGSYSESEHYLILDTTVRRWRLVELLTLGLLALLRIKLRCQQWDLVNVHIAYPLLRFPRVFKFLFGNVTVISEHWSAYRYSFHLPDGSPARRRIRNIFRHSFPVISVSNALSRDIATFSGGADYRRYVVPNVVDPAVFYPPEAKDWPATPVFLMASSWAPIKQPLLVLQAFAALLRRNPGVMLKIAGYGEQWEAIRGFVESNSLSGNVMLLGPKSKPDIASEMRACSAFLHASEYETFSVVCAEALCSGLPVIASNVGGIVEFVDESNGILVENTREEWVNALAGFVGSGAEWDYRGISQKAVAQFSPQSVGPRIAEVYRESLLLSREP